MERPQERKGRAKSGTEKEQKEFDIDRKRDDDVNVDYETLKNTSPKTITKFYQILEIPYDVSDFSYEWTNEGEVQITISKNEVSPE